MTYTVTTTTSVGPNLENSDWTKITIGTLQGALDHAANKGQVFLDENVSQYSTEDLYDYRDAIAKFRDGKGRSFHLNIGKMHYWVEKVD